MRSVEVGLVAAQLDLLVQEFVGRTQAAGELPAGAERAEVLAGRGPRQQERAAADNRDELLAQALDPRGFGHAEHGPADDLERERAHPAAQRELRRRDARSRTRARLRPG